MVVAGVATLAYIYMKNRPLTLDVARPEQAVAVRVFGLGTVEAQVLSRVGFAVAGSLDMLAVDHGDNVKKGDVLGALNVAEQGARVRQAEAAVLVAEMNIHKAEASVLRARATYEQRRDDSLRKQSLTGQNAVSQQLAGEAMRDEKVAAADLAVAEAEVDVAKIQRLDAEAKRAFEKTILNQHTLRAPYDAIVIERAKEKGSVVNAGEVIFSLIATNSTWILTYIDEQLAGSLKVGQLAEIRLRSQPNMTYHGKVARIGLESDRANEERKAWLSCDDCPQQLYIGEQSEALITVASLETAIMVPQNAIYKFDGSHGLVWMINEGRLQQVPVTFGLKDERARYQLLDGVPDGALLVTSRGPGLVEGRSAAAAPVKP